MANPKNPGAPEGAEVVFLGSPFGGWVSTPAQTFSAPHYTASIEGSQGALEKQQTNQYAESNGISLFRKERFGHIAPGQAFDELTDVAGAGGTRLITDLPLNGVTTSSGNAWTVLKNGRLIVHTFVSTSAAIDPDVSSGTHSGETIQSTNNGDVLSLYDYASPQVEYVLWGWETGIDADIDVVLANSPNTQTKNWYTGLTGYAAANKLLKNVPHKMCKGPDGNICVTNGSNVQQIVLPVGTSLLNVSLASTISNILPLGADLTATGIAAYKNYYAIIASKTSAGQASNVAKGGVSVFLWDGKTSTVNGVTSVAANYIFDIPDNYGNAIYFDGNVLYAFTNGRNNSSKIWEFTGKGFKKVFETPLLSTTATPTQGSIENFQDSIMIGATKYNENPYLFRFYGGGFHCEALMSDGTNTATQIGMVKNLEIDWMFVGVKYGSTYAIWVGQNGHYQVNAQIKTVLYTQGILGRRMYPLGFKMTMNRIVIFLSQWGTGASLTLSLYKDYTTTDLLASKVLDTATYPVGTTEIDISDIAIADVSTFYMTVTFSHASKDNTAAIIRHMVMYMSPSQ